jgi:UDP-N-acetylmuramoyl-L-alanyl-D-glutamate--2,6-diaminopimelate ligase
MNSQHLLKYCNPVSVKGSLPGSVGELHMDSRKVQKNDVFIAIKGLQADGHEFVRQAADAGASAIITEKDVEPLEETAVIRVNNTRSLLSPLAQKFAGDPAKKLRIIAITGTNGKTTVATLVWQALRRIGEKAALLGTVRKMILDSPMDSRLTTADPIELARDMRAVVDAGCRYLVMEVSSHALHQQRVHGIPFEVAAFTNLSHDHLDYHETMEEYAASKKILFDDLGRNSWAVINADDLYAAYMIQNSLAKQIDFSFENKALFNAMIWSMSAAGSVVEVEGVEIRTPLPGRFNAINVVQAMLICTALGLDGQAIAEVLTGCPGAEGRMEKINPEQGNKSEPLVIVDYAHTPDALKNVASTLKDVKNEDQQLVIVFGCGGDRDKTKRPEMASIAETYGDRVIVTSDNPRTEDSDAIIEDIKGGFSEGFSYDAIPSRRDAIHKAISEGSGKSIVLIAGKGHETYQEIGTERIHFDDREEALKALESAHRNGKTAEVN